MNYTIGESARISKVSARTLRCYEELGLLTVGRAATGYRVYTSDDLACLQTLLFYREFEKDKDHPFGSRLQRVHSS